MLAKPRQVAAVMVAVVVVTGCSGTKAKTNTSTTISSSPTVSDGATTTSAPPIVVGGTTTTAARALKAPPTCGMPKGQSQPSGTVLLTADQIAAAAGAKITSATLSSQNLVLLCTYQFSNAGSLILSVDENSPQAQADFVSHSRSGPRPLATPGCADCKLGNVAFNHHFGDAEYIGRSSGGAYVVGVISGPLYFELDSPGLQLPKLELLAQTILTFV